MADLACTCGAKPALRTWHDEDGMLWAAVKCSCGKEGPGKWVHPGNDCPMFYQETRDLWSAALMKNSAPKS